MFNVFLTFLITTLTKGMALQERSSVGDICTKDLHLPVRQAAEFQAVCSPGCKQGVEASPEEAMKVHGLEQLSHKERLRELGRFSLEKKRRGGAFIAPSST